MHHAEPRYQIAAFKDTMVPMRDGVRLAADVIVRRVTANSWMGSLRRS